MSGRKIILFELNEVPFRILDHYCRRHPNSVLASRLPQCHQYETYAEDSRLTPWVTWPTVHRGITDEQHRIHHFGQDLQEVDRAFPPLWKILASHSVRTGVFGSLHSYPLPEGLENYAFYFPDTFAAGSECFPANLSVFQEFNLGMARRSNRNVAKGLPWKSALRLLRHLPDLGFKPATLVDTAQQVYAEWKNPARRVRRRTYQVVLAFDIFMKQLQATRPAFATFFSNHVASSMHRYWAAAFPEDYDSFGYGQDWVSTYRDEIDFTVGKFEAFFARLVRLVDADPEYTLWVTTSIGQAATSAQPTETQLCVADLERFMAAFGVGKGEWSRRPAMEPDYSVFVAPSRAETFRQGMKKLVIDGRPVVCEEHDKGFFAFALIFFNLHYHPYALLDGKEIPFEQLGLANMQIEDMTNTNAYHIPTGSLLIYDPLHRSPKPGRPQISTREIAPAVLRNFSIRVPGYMAAGPALAGG